MTKSRIMKLSALAGVSLMLFTTVGCSDESLKFSDLPQKVRDTAQSYSQANGELGFKAERKGKTAYEVAYKNGAHDIELIIKEDGTLEAIEDSLTFMPPQRSALNHEIEPAASLMEDAIEAAIVDNRTLVGKKLAEFERALPALKVSIGEDRHKLIGKILALTEQAYDSDDMLQTALYAVEIYRLLVNAMDFEKVEIPKQVSLLDYSGFKLSALAANPTPDWPEIEATSAEAIRFWQSVEQDVQNTGLHDLVQSLFQGMETAITQRDRSMLVYAAQMDLGVVDLLEGYFQKRWKETKGSFAANSEK